jgi:hypothetical protein
MRAVIIGTDFLKDTDGSFKAIETNTNIGMDVAVNNYIDKTNFENFVLTSSFNEIHLIYTDANVSITDTPKVEGDVTFVNFLLKSICEPNEITLVKHKLDETSMTIPFVEDGDNKLIIRLAYDTTALLDDTYARDNWEFLKLMYDNDANSIPKCYISDTEFDINNIGDTLRDNGNHPNYAIKKRITPTDNKIYPKLHKLTSIEDLNNLKSSLEIDEYIQEYIYNTNELIDNKTFHYRSVDLIYSDLNSLNLFVYEKTNILPIVDSCDFDDDNKIQIWDRPRYLSKVLNGTAEISVKLDADETTKVVMSDDTIKTANNLNVNDLVKSITLQDDISFLVSDEWSGSFSNICENFNVTTSAVVEKDTFNYFGEICNLTLVNGSKFSDVPHGKIFKVIEKATETSTETLVVQSNYSQLKVNDRLLLIDIETNTIETSLIQTIEYSFESLQAYRINIEESDVFLSMEETENQSKYAILTHNYDYDCRRLFCQTYGDVQAFECGSGNVEFPYQCGDVDGGCYRYGGPYAGPPFHCYYFGVYGCNLSCDADWSVAYCNGNKPSDKKLKKNIKYSHTLSRGFKIYTFEFIDEFVTAQKDVSNDDYSGKWQGVLAQDLLDTEYENCLNLREDGYFEVDYSKLNIEFKKI